MANGRSKRRYEECGDAQQTYLEICAAVKAGKVEWGDGLVMPDGETRPENYRFTPPASMADWPIYAKVDTAEPVSDSPTIESACGGPRIKQAEDPHHQSRQTKPTDDDDAGYVQPCTRQHSKECSLLFKAKRAQGTAFRQQHRHLFRGYSPSTKKGTPATAEQGEFQVPRDPTSGRTRQSYLNSMAVKRMKLRIKHGKDIDARKFANRRLRWLQQRNPSPAEWRTRALKTYRHPHHTRFEMRNGIKGGEAQFPGIGRGYCKGCLDRRWEQMERNLTSKVPADVKRCLYMGTRKCHTTWCKTQADEREWLEEEATAFALEDPLEDLQMIEDGL